MPQVLDILQFANALPIGGTERQFVNLVRGLDRTVFRVHVGCLLRDGLLVRELDELQEPLTEYRIHHLYGATTIGQQMRLARNLVDKQIRIVHTHGFYANVFAIPAAWFARTPVRIASIRDDGSVWTRSQRVVERLACKLADCTVVNAESIRLRLVREGWAPDKVAVIRNGVDIARFERARPVSQLRSEFGLPPTGPIVAVLARLSASKGLEVFLDAVQLLNGQFPDARFLIVGDENAFHRGGLTVGGPYGRGLEQRAERMGLIGRVVFTGFRLDVPEILAEVAISVLPSVIGEGLPNSILESMAAGLPVVGTTSGGTPEAVEDGQTGLLVPPGDAPALAQAMARLLSDAPLRARLGEAGRRRVTERFSLQGMTLAMQHLYEDLLQRRRRISTPREKAMAA